MFELDERDRLRKTYQAARQAFGILSLALILASFTAVITLAFQFTHLRLFYEILASSWFRWIDAPIIWASLLGTTLLWGRWDNASWQRRTGLLLVMCLVDVVLWVMDQGSDLKLLNREFGHDWLRRNLGSALGWAELALITTLASDYLVHLGSNHVREAAKSTRSLLATGGSIWLLLFCIRTNWRGGWPLQPQPVMRLPEGLLLSMGVVIVHTIALIQVTALTLSATRQSMRVLEDLDRDDPYREYFGTHLEDEKKDPYEVASSRSGERW